MEEKWSDRVEDLVDRGDTNGAISLLETLISELEPLSNSSSDLRLASALNDLANLYSSRGFSIKADELRNRSFLIKHRSHQTPPLLLRDVNGAKKLDSDEARVSNCHAPASDDDDWEAVADRSPNELFSPQLEAGVSNLSVKDNECEAPKQRGRGAFMYRTNGLYSDQQTEASIYDSGDETTGHDPEDTRIRNSKYGTNHVLVLSGFPSTTRTTALEKDFESFRDRGVVIRWVNDTVALAVFRTPELAHEARSSTSCPYSVRMLEEDDDLLTLLSDKDLEPPYPRPKTSTRTAQRLIAQGMGHKLSTSFGSTELRKQEEARKNRILMRKNLRDEAWGSDDQ